MLHIRLVVLLWGIWRRKYVSNIPLLLPPALGWHYLEHRDSDLRSFIITAVGNNLFFRGWGWRFVLWWFRISFKVFAPHEMLVIAPSVIEQLFAACAYMHVYPKIGLNGKDLSSQCWCWLSAAVQTSRATLGFVGLDTRNSYDVCYQIFNFLLFIISQDQCQNSSSSLFSSVKCEKKSLMADYIRCR